MAEVVLAVAIEAAKVVEVVLAVAAEVTRTVVEVARNDDRGMGLNWRKVSWSAGDQRGVIVVVADASLPLQHRQCPAASTTHHGALPLPHSHCPAAGTATTSTKKRVKGRPTYERRAAL